MDTKSEKLALFRYGLIASLVIERLPRGELTRRAQEIAARTYDIPHSKRTGVCVDTLLNWALRYRNGSFEALAPKPRQDRGQSRAVTPQLASLIERLKRENPHRTGTTLLRELALSSGQDRPALSASTLYRFLKQHGLSEKALRSPPNNGQASAKAMILEWNRTEPPTCPPPHTILGPYNSNCLNRSVSQTARSRLPSHRFASPTTAAANQYGMWIQQCMVQTDV